VLAPGPAGAARFVASPVALPSGPDLGLAVPAVDFAAERAELGASLEAALKRVLASGQYIGGPEVEAFEREFAATQGVGVGNGTDALVLCLKALDLKPGDEVLTTPFSFFSSAAAIAWAGALPRFTDVEPHSALLSPETLEAHLTPRTRAIVAVHLYGQLCDLVGLQALCQRRGLFLIEDAAQAHGAERAGRRAGQGGGLTAVSFYPTKNLGALGDAGLVLSEDAALASRLRRLRDHGSRAKYQHEELGCNSRLDALQAAALRVKLPHLARWNQRRAELAALYTAHLAGHPGLSVPQPAADSRPCWHQYALRIRAGALQRDQLREQLAREGIACSVHYPQPIHLQPAASSWGYRAGQFPAAEAWAREVLCLPLHPFLSEAQLERVCARIHALVPVG
jgi:dTDP-3-amino-3,4,6-trideoxy-alpha-D-glucose transaminase